MLRDKPPDLCGDVDPRGGHSTTPHSPRRSTMKLIPYLMFTKGQCREALDFYAKALNGKVISVSTYGAMPSADQHLPLAAMDKVANAHLIAGGASIMGADNVMGEETGEAR